MDLKGEQQASLRQTVEWARKIRASLQKLLDADGSRVHFRPSSGGVAMIGLHHEWPQRGKSGIRDLESLERDFEKMFGEHCCGIEQRRGTPEKALQSALIREAYANGRRMVSLNAASAATDDPVELVFVTDEIPMPIDVEGKRIVCDILALRRDGGRSTPVLLELKSARMLEELVGQVEAYAPWIDAHADLFAELFGALLGERVSFDGPTEKWIVWPAGGGGAEKDRQEEKLAGKGIRVVGYQESPPGKYELRVGRGVAK